MKESATKCVLQFCVLEGECGNQGVGKSTLFFDMYLCSIYSIYCTHVQWVGISLKVLLSIAKLNLSS